MFDIKNTLVMMIIYNEKNTISKYDIVNQVIEKGLIENVSVNLTDREIYNRSVAKWFFRLANNFDAIKKMQAEVSKCRFTRKNLSTTYSKLIKSLYDYNIYLASYHDLLLHFLVTILRIEIPQKDITWKKIENFCSNSIKSNMKRIYTILRKEIIYRNSSVHDFDYNWIEKYITNETARFLDLMGINELNELLLPLQGQLVYNANIEVSQIKEDIISKIQQLESITYDLFKDLIVYYKK